MTSHKVPLYCSEQIRIPEKLPEIMKTFCKAAIMTQPYDVLKWSASYFRSLADDLPPIMKTCLEKENKTKYITKGCVKMFIEHIGKGFFVHRRVFSKIWENVLPMEDFYKLLSLAKMFYWRELHWLKLIGVMAGFLSNDLRSTMLLICDLLTNNLESGISKIPIWMFITIYKFLAELDCSKEQRFLNGRKELKNGSFEELIEPYELPYVMSALSLNRCLMESCADDGFVNCASNESLNNEISKLSQNETEAIKNDLWLKDFKMHGKIEEPARLLKKCQDFDTLIFYIKTHHIQDNLATYEGPHHINPKTLQNARDKEKKVAALRENFAVMYRDNVVYQNAFEDKVNLLKDIGPPWSWLFDFTACSGQNKSYNFIDDESIISDKTPGTSSDESYDYVYEKPTAYCTMENKNDFESAKSISTYESSCDERNMSELLINRGRETRISQKTRSSSIQAGDSDRSLSKLVRSSSLKKKSPFEFEVVVHEFASKMHLAYDEETSSDYDVQPNLERILKEADKMTSDNIDYGFITDILNVALNNSKNFKNLDEVFNYVREEYTKWYNIQPINIPLYNKDESTCESIIDEKWVEKEDVSQISNEISLSAYNFGAGDYQGSRAEQRECKESDKPKRELPVILPKKEIIQKNIEHAFGDDITIDPKVKSRKVEKDMILGLMSDNEPTDKTYEEQVTSELSEGSYCVDKSGYYSDDSSIFPVPEIENDHNIKFKEYKQTCELPIKSEIYDYKLPHIPGIGGKVSEKVTVKFLEFIKFCAYKQQGMIMKSNLLEEKCPPLEDLMPFKIVDDLEFVQTSNQDNMKLSFNKCPSEYQ